MNSSYLLMLALFCNIYTKVQANADVDWLIQQSNVRSYVREACWDYEQSPPLCGIELGNGLLQRRFVTKPAFGSIDFILNATTSYGGEQSMFRTVKPEGEVWIDGVNYPIGGVTQNTTFLAYCNRSDLTLLSSNSSFVYSYYKISTPKAPFPWTPGTRGSPKEYSWPPKGVTLEVTFKPVSGLSPKLDSLSLVVTYEMYDDIPLLSKWITIEMDRGCTGDCDVVVNAITVELFGAMPRFGAYIGHGSFSPGADGEGASGSGPPPPLLHAKTDQAHGTHCSWQDDYFNSADPVPGCPLCKDEGANEPYLNCSYTIGPGAHVNINENFTSFRVFLLATDSTDLTRHTLSRHRVTQLLAPHTTENPIFFHATDVSDIGFKTAVDQLSEVGFEMLIFSFGTGFNIETADPKYIAQIKNQIDYAKSKGIEVGGYDLICLERGHGGYGGNVGDQWDVVDPKTGQLTADACFASGWYDKLNSLILNFINQTGLSMLETDGPYGGSACGSHTHVHHHEEEDSIYKQTQLQSNFYKQMRTLNVYINQPDDYFFQGGSRTAMGYDEQQYSLPRMHDLSISRMGLYDDLYVHLPTQGWMFVPLTVYHAGGEGAEFLDDTEAYEWALAQYLGAGTAACYRGPMLYHTDVMKEILIKWVSFYKKHRTTLTQPVVHLARPSMQSWDGWLHVNPFSLGNQENEIGVAMLFNPTQRTIEQVISLPLYFCGVEDMEYVFVEVDGVLLHMKVQRDYSVLLNVKFLPNSIHTVVINKAQ